MVTVDERLRGPRAKIERADQQIGELNEALTRFVDSHPYEVVCNQNPETNRWVYTASRIDPVPDSITLIAGDVIHNMRVALDHLAWQLVEANRGKPDHNTAFPVWRKSRTPNRQDLEAAAGGKLKGAHPEVITAVIDMETHRRGNGNNIWVLDALDLTDKHRLLLSTMSRVASVAPDFASLIGAEFAAFGMPADAFPNIALVPADQRVEVGTELYITLDDEPEPNVQFTFDISIDEPGVAELEPIVPLLSNLLQVTSQTIEAFIPFLS